jgi:hypothetical protein
MGRELMSEPRLVKLDFDSMLNSDCPIVCRHWLLSNSKNQYGIDFTEPMYFNEFLRNIGEHLSGLNCKGLFKNAEWFIWTCDSDEIIRKYFLKVK